MVKKVFATLVLLIAAVPLFAAGDAPEGRRTVIVRDGKVIFDESSPGVKRGFLGVSTTGISEDLREFFGAPREAGVLVSSVVENGPAAKAGVHVGDIITAINGKTVDDVLDLVLAMREKKNGDSVRVDVIRGKTKQTIVATVEEREAPDTSLRAFDLRLDRDRLLPRGEWRATVTTPELETLRDRIHDLEIRLKELQKKLDNK